MPIEVKNLTHIYGEGTPFERTALDSITLTINDGEFVGIIGHTGSGKSTLISYFNGLTKPESGVVFVNGADIGEKNVDLTEIRKTVGLVFQYPEYQLFEETVAKDIAFGPKNLKLSEAEIKSRVESAMQMVGLDAYLAEKSPFELSGGQKRRVAIAGVLAMQPSILILDEPAAGLDPVGRKDMLDLVKKIHASGVTVAMVSHSMDDVGRLCDRLFVLDHGKIAFTGTPAEVFRNADALKAIGLDVPEYAKLANHLREAGWDIEEGLYRIEDVRKAILSQIG
ncbi:MAG: energy-coupling factor transporter ATPase [Clostridiales bacterium]|nr:energy-coupling factor transporter ATPase [Clostridiales bacterium]